MFVKALMLIAPIAFLALASPKFSLIESIPTYPKSENPKVQQSNSIIGSPLATTFYLFHSETTPVGQLVAATEQFTTGGPPSKTVNTLFKKSPDKPKSLIQILDENLRFIGTDRDGKPVFRAVTTLHAESNTPVFNTLIWPGSETFDSGTVYYRPEYSHLTVSGPWRETDKIALPSSSYAKRSSVVHLKNVDLISSDGRDHLILLTQIDKQGQKYNSLNLFEWGSLDQLNLINTFLIPRKDNTNEVKISALAAGNRGKCFIALDTWKNSNQYTRSILYINIEAGTQEVVESLPLENAFEMSDSMPSAQRIELSTIQNGQFVAIEDQKSIRIYHQSDK